MDDRREESFLFVTSNVDERAFVRVIGMQSTLSFGSVEVLNRLYETRRERLGIFEKIYRSRNAWR